jgi:TolB-like protein/Flp pilus assembly protein TadD
LSESQFTELKRRKVFTVGVAYLVLAWIVIQVTTIAVPAFNMPEWMNTVIFFLALIGFPFAIFFAWAFKIKPNGINKESPIPTKGSITSYTGRKRVFVTLGLVVLLAVSYSIYNADLGAKPAKVITAKEPTVHSQRTNDVIQQTPPSSIAVLPFVNMSSDKEQEYFSDGISEEILNVLVKIPKLHVTSRSSSFFYKGRDIKTSEVAQDLGVNNVLAGSVRKSGNRVRITAQLIEAGTDKNLWSETYDKELTANNIFIIQDEISGAIVDALKLTLKTEQTKVVGTTTSNMEAYDALLQGRFEYQKRGQGDHKSITNAIELFQTAILLDSNYADAYAELGRALTANNDYGVSTNYERQVKLARLVINKALTLDPNNYLAILTSGIIKFHYDADFESAETDFLRAIELSPNNDVAYNFYGDYLRTMYRLDDAIEVEHRAALLAPKSLVSAMEYGFTLIMGGRVEEGFNFLQTELVKSPEAPVLKWVLADEYVKFGRTEEALTLYKQLYQSPVPFYSHTYLAFMASQGDKAAMTKFLAIDKKLTNNINYQLLTTALYFNLGKYDESAIWLNKLIEKSASTIKMEGLSIFDPAKNIDHVGLNKILNTPDIAKWMKIRRENYELFNNQNNPL